MSGGRLECAQSIQRYIRSHARAPIDANPPRSTAFPVFAPGLHETRQRTSSNFSQIRAETLGAMGAARMHDSRSADLFDGLLSGKNPPWGMTGGSRRRRSRVQKAYADHYKLNGLGKSCQVWLRCRGAIWAIQNHKDERRSNKVTQNSYAACSGGRSPVRRHETDARWVKLGPERRYRWLRLPCAVQGGAFQWAQVPPGIRSSRKQPEQAWR
jgi:hypothetical protein